MLGVAVVLDNRGGAGGTLGMAAVARAAPDGHTIVVGHIGTLGVNPSLFPNMQYDPVNSYHYIAPLALVPNVMVVHPSLPVKTIRELIDLANAKPGQLNYATAGTGSAAHIAMAAFNVAAKVQMVAVPYRGTNPAVIDLLAGQTQITMTGVTAVLQHVRSGCAKSPRWSAERRARFRRARAAPHKRGIVGAPFGAPLPRIGGSRGMQAHPAPFKQQGRRSRWLRAV